MRAIIFGAAEVALLRKVLEPPLQVAGATKPEQRAAQTILAKLVKAERKADPSVNAPELERELVLHAGNKVVPLASANWPRYARQASQLGCTSQDMRAVGLWLKVQGWVQPRSQTLESVLRNWSGWLGKARAQADMTRPQAGFNGDVGPGTSPERQVNTGGRPATGFGRKAPATRGDGFPGAG